MVAVRLRSCTNAARCVQCVAVFTASNWPTRAEVWHDSPSLFSDVIAKQTAGRGRDNPSLSLAYNNRGVAFKNRGTTDAALADFAEAIRINPEDSRGFVNRANLYFIRQDHVRARPDYDHAIALDPDNAIAFSNRGGLFANTGRLDTALVDFDRALELNPTSSTPCAAARLVLYTQAHFDRAFKDADRYVTLNRNADAFGLRAVIEQGLGRQRETKADFSAAIELDPRGGIYYRDRSVFYRQQGDRVRALQDARTARVLVVSIDSMYVRSLE